MSCIRAKFAVLPSYLRLPLAGAVLSWSLRRHAFPNNRSTPFGSVSQFHVTERAAGAPDDAASASIVLDMIVALDLRLCINPTDWNTVS
jgi:hypothetical protein